MLTHEIMSQRKDRMVWIDLEMTGLDIDVCTIIEIATVVTDGELNIIAQGPNMAIHTTDENLAAMDEWNTTHHGSSGLTERVRNTDVDMADAERQTLDFLAQHIDPQTSPLCGNSIWNDRKFIEKYMPELADFLHYRMIDVSTIKELAKRWYPDIKQYYKKGAHLALDDILESIEELKYFRKKVFIDQP